MVLPRLRQVVIDTKDPRSSAEFWRQLLGLVYRNGHEPPPQGSPDSAGRDWLNLQTEDGHPVLAFQYVEELPESTWPEAITPQQLHLDLSVSTFIELQESFGLAISLGGRLLFDRREDDVEPLVVIADTAGHPFCIFVSTN